MWKSSLFYLPIPVQGGWRSHFRTTHSFQSRAGSASPLIPSRTPPHMDWLSTDPVDALDAILASRRSEAIDSLVATAKDTAGGAWSAWRMVLPHDQVISPADPPALRLQSYDSAFGAMFRLKRPRSLSFEELLVHPIPRARRGASVDSAIKESVDALGRMLVHMWAAPGAVARGTIAYRRTAAKLAYATLTVACIGAPAASGEVLLCAREVSPDSTPPRVSLELLSPGVSPPTSPPALAPPAAAAERVKEVGSALAERIAGLASTGAPERRGRKRGNPYGRSPARSKGFAWHQCEAPTVNGPVRDPEERFWVELEEEDIKREFNARVIPEGFACAECGLSETPMTRPGPLGPGTLCNACGIKWKNLRKAHS